MNLILFFTGNPPIPTVYEDFFARLKQNLVNVELHEIPLYTTKTNLEDMDLEILFKLNAKTALDLIKNKNYQNIYLVGHSIGCSAILSHNELLSRYATKYFFIQPYIFPSKGNLLFLETIQNHLISYFLFFSVGFISKVKPVYNFGVKKFTNKSAKTPLIAQELNLKFIQRLLRVLKTYLTFFRQNDLIKILNQIPTEKQISFFSPGDFWSNLEIKKVFEYSEELRVNHDFCLNKNQSLLVASELTKHFQKPLNKDSFIIKPRNHR